jgi:hypothetical protein
MITQNAVAGLVKAVGGNIFPPSSGASPIEIVPIPSGLGWDSVNWPVVIGLQVSAINTRTFGVLAPGSFNIANNPKYIACMAGAKFYVSTSGSDTNPGTSGSPFRSIYYAIGQLNATLAPGVIYILSGTYGRSYTFTNGVIYPTVDIMFIATGGRVVATTHDQGLTWTADATYTNTYASSTLSSAPARVLDIMNKDSFGLYPDFLSVSSVIECNAKPWTYYYDSGTTKVYVNRGDGQVVRSIAVTTSGSEAAANTWVLRQVANFQYTGVQQRSFFFFGQSEGDGFDFIGAANAAASQGAITYTSGLNITAASASGGIITCTVSSTAAMVSGQSCYIVGTQGLVFDGTYTATVVNGTTFTIPSAATGTYTNSPASAQGSVCQNYSRNHTIYMSSCSFRYTGYQNGLQNGNGLNLNNFCGTSVLLNSDASGNSTDGFNFHDSRYFGHQVLANNNTGSRNGMGSKTPGNLSNSNNALTSHEGVVMIDIAGDYTDSSGYTVHCINTTCTFCVATVARNSRGDRYFGATFNPGEFRVSDSAKMWVYSTSAQPSSSTHEAYTASDTSIMYYSNLRPYFGTLVISSGASWIPF